jgi:hypothetical protein
VASDIEKHLQNIKRPVEAPATNIATVIYLKEHNLLSGQSLLWSSGKVAATSGKS